MIATEIVLLRLTDIARIDLLSYMCLETQAQIHAFLNYLHLRRQEVL